MNVSIGDAFIFIKDAYATNVASNPKLWHEEELLYVAAYDDKDKHMIICPCTRVKEFNDVDGTIVSMNNSIKTFVDVLYDDEILMWQKSCKENSKDLNNNNRKNDTIFTFKNENASYFGGTRHKIITTTDCFNYDIKESIVKATPAKIRNFWKFHDKVLNKLNNSAEKIRDMITKRGE